jgi:hypothetical protein
VLPPITVPPTTVPPTTVPPTTVPPTTVPLQSASAETSFTITNVRVLQTDPEKSWISVSLAGQETSTESFKLILTQPQIVNSTFRHETLFENKWIAKGVSYLPRPSITTGGYGNYQYTIQAVTTSGITSNTYGFSFNYFKAPEPPPLTWRQAGCDDLTELNKEALDDWYSDSRLKALWADGEVQSQRIFAKTSSLGCPNELAWKWKTVKVKEFVWRYTVCADGSSSGSRGRGTCSWHGGVSHEMGYYKTVNAKRVQFYWVY